MGLNIYFEQYSYYYEYLMLQEQKSFCSWKFWQNKYENNFRSFESGESEYKIKCRPCDILWSFKIDNSKLWIIVPKNCY